MTQAMELFDCLFEWNGFFRYCFQWEQKEHKTNGERQVLDVEQIKQLNPVEVAMLYYREKCGEDMNEKMQEMLQGIIQEIEQTNN